MRIHQHNLRAPLLIYKDPIARILFHYCYIVNVSYLLLQNEADISIGDGNSNQGGIDPAMMSQLRRTVRQIISERTPLNPTNSSGIRTREVFDFTSKIFFLNKVPVIFAMDVDNSLNPALSWLVYILYQRSYLGPEICDPYVPLEWLLRSQMTFCWFL